MTLSTPTPTRPGAAWKQPALVIALALVHVSLPWVALDVRSDLYAAGTITPMMGLGIELSNHYFAWPLMGTYFVGGFLLITRQLDWANASQRAINRVITGVYGAWLVGIFAFALASVVAALCLTAEGVSYLW